MDKFKLILNYDKYVIELSDIDTLGNNLVDNNSNYDLAYKADEEKGSQHTIKIFEDNQLYKSALICASGGTTIHEHSAVIDGNAIFICCGVNVFSLSLPDLALNWITEVDMAICFGIYEADNGLFTHGELTVTRLSQTGEIIWSEGLRDIIVNTDENNEQEAFVMHDTYISLLDFSGNKYQLGFNGRFISG